MFRKLLRPTMPLLLAILPLGAFLFILGSALIPSDKALACLPCQCRHNHALNCYGGFHVNTIVNPRTGDCAIEVLGIDGSGRGYRAIYATAAELAEVPDHPEQNTLIEQYYEYALYRLTSGEYQVNVGPLAENKVYVVVFDACPATQVKESTYIAGEG